MAAKNVDEKTEFSLIALNMNIAFNGARLRVGIVFFLRFSSVFEAMSSWRYLLSSNTGKQYWRKTPFVALTVM
ncbi:MAG: hypothetical protein KAG97_13185 [Victivallales bacterium]|nr:hypothetical protein [Victivallales bacterium]